MGWKRHGAAKNLRTRGGLSREYGDCKVGAEIDNSTCDEEGVNGCRRAPESRGRTHRLEQFGYAKPRRFEPCPRFLCVRLGDLQEDVFEGAVAARFLAEVGECTAADERAVMNDADAVR